MNYMHRQASKRRKRAQLTFIYLLMSLAVVISVAVLILVVQGYRFNRYDGKVEQGGLVQFDSRPSGAAVMVDTVNLANKTPSKITVTAGDHTVTLSRAGYNSWQKDVTVKPGSVLWLNYARMLPTTLQPTEAVSLSAVSGALVSPDRKWLAAVEAADTPTITVVDTNASTPFARKVTIAPGIYTAPPEGVAQEFTLQSWDQDSRYVLVKHTAGDRTEYISVDTRSGDNARNVSTLLGVDALSMTYHLADSQSVVIVTTLHEVRIGDLNAKTLSAPLLTNVGQVTQSDRSTLVYTTLPDESGARQSGYLTIGSSKPRVVRTTTDSGATFYMRFGRYYNQNYVVVVNGDQTEILAGGLPASDSDTTLSWKRIALLQTIGGVDYFGFSPGENRFVYLQKGGEVTTYDLELLNSIHTTLATTSPRAIDWLDAYHMGTSSGGAASMVDFDGTNHQTIASNQVLDHPSFISEDNRFVYYFTAKENGVSLMRAKLTIE